MIAVVFRISMWRDLDRLLIIATPVVVMLDIVRFYKQRNVVVCVRYLQLDCLLLLRFFAQLKYSCFGSVEKFVRVY